MDVKYVPYVCYVGTDGEKFYQYTMLEETSRKRFIYAYKENNSHSSIDFVQRAIIFFGYAPETIQTDHDGEFTDTQKTNRIHPFDMLCNKLHITHKILRPRTPWHNGKVERSHRNDQERFYNHLSFYSYDDLQVQMKRFRKFELHLELNQFFRSHIIDKCTVFYNLFLPFLQNRTCIIRISYDKIMPIASQ